MRRRSLLKALGAGAAASLLPLPLLARSLGAYPFAVGVASGDPAADGFVIWTRLVASALEERGGIPTVRVPVRWEVARDPAFARVVCSGEALAHPELGHSVHVEVDGLLPHRPYWYRFHVAGAGNVSPVGTARTLPASSSLPERLRFAVAGCQNYEHGYFNAWAALAREPDLDLVFHYGDYIYESAAGALGRRGNGVVAVRQHVGGELFSVDDYRRRYAQYKSDPDLQEAHAAAAFLCSFDDHELDNNWVGDISEENLDPEIFRLRRLAAMQAWYENMPVRRTMFPRLTGTIAHRRLDYGGLARLHVLDTRTHRSDQPCDDGKLKPCVPEARTGGTVLGFGQEAWLDQGLANDARWNLIAQQLLFQPLDLRKQGDPNPLLATDAWDGYRGARQRLIRSIQRHGLSNVVVVSGDYHRNIVGEVPVDDADPAGDKAAVEFLATSISSESPKTLEPMEHIERSNPHLRLFDDQRGYHLLDFTPRELVANVRSVADTKSRGSGLAGTTRFVVSPDRPVVHRV